MKILCLFGQHQYGNKLRGESTESFSFIPALRALGHNVTLYDSWNKSLHEDFSDLNCALLDECRERRPDVILWVALTVEIWLETLNYLRSTFGIRIIHWAPDDSWKFYQHSRFIASHVDLCVTTYPEFLAAYEKLGARAVASGWGIPEAWRGNIVPAAACRYDVSFVGTAQPAREEMIAALRQRGVDVACFGHGWPSGAIAPENIPYIFRNSRISLNFSNSSGANQVKARMFEVTGAGGFLLTQTAPGLNSIFELGHEIVVFNDLDECVSYVRRYLDEPADRDTIAMAGNRRTLMEYTYVERLRTILASLPARSETQLAPMHDDYFRSAVLRHSNPFFLRFLANILIAIGIIIFGRRRGPRFARRLIFEICWRLTGKATYRSSGIVGRMFYEQ